MRQIEAPVFSVRQQRWEAYIFIIFGRRYWDIYVFNLYSMTIQLLTPCQNVQFAKRPTLLCCQLGNVSFKGKSL